MDVLVSWIGSADLLSIRKNAPQEIENEIGNKVGNRQAKETGPLFTLASERIFDEIHLLSDWKPNVGKYFKDQLVAQSKTTAKVTLHNVEIANPISYEEIFQATDNFLETVYHPLKSSDTLFIFLTPGTPAMTAIWVLLGKTKYPAKFLQTCKDTEVPADKQGLKDKNVIDENIPISFTMERQYLAENKEMLHLIEEGFQNAEEFKQIVGSSESLGLAIGRAKRAAQFDAPILLCGETGTGKELFARAIHDVSPRKKSKYIALNCAAVPKELLESELFGYVKNAFTGAIKNKDGAFKTADKGTLFLDEIGECSLDLQAKLLRALQPKKDSASLTRLAFRPVGAEEDTEVDVRIIAATNRDLQQMIRDKQFREDLYYRLAVIPINLPPLRERTGDIEILANSFLENFNRQFARNPQYQDKKFSPGTMNFIKSQAWTGNVRELHSVIWYAVAMGDGTEITPADIAAAIHPGPHKPAFVADNVELGDDFNIKDYLGHIEKELIIKALQETKGNLTQAAKILGYTNYQNLSHCLKKYNMSLEDFKQDQ